MPFFELPKLILPKNDPFQKGSFGSELFFSLFLLLLRLFHHLLHFPGEFSLLSRFFLVLLNLRVNLFFVNDKVLYHEHDSDGDQV